MSRQSWDFLVSEGEVAGEGLSQGELKKIMVSKIPAKTKDKIRDSQAEKKVKGHWVEIKGLSTEFTQLEVREILSRISTLEIEKIKSCEDVWRVELHVPESKDFFIKMVDGKTKYKGSVLRLVSWISSYSVDDVWHQLERISDLQRLKITDGKQKVNAVGEGKKS